MQKLAVAVSPSTASRYGSCRGAAVEDGAKAEFPAGMRVLVVDDDVTCLRILEHMLQRCRYRVTTCCQATMALSLLRESKGGYDVVISDVHMPDMDGFKLLELVGLEMDLPVIMMSADGRTSAVMRGIKHGACDYLIKPVRIEELKNIWQHVIRKKWSDNKELEHSGSLEDSDRHQRVVDDADYSSSVNDGADGNWRSQKKKRDSTVEEDDGELDNEDPSSSKKPRVVWSVELHQQFVSAVNQLGIEKAVPKRILELMNVPGLTRENVASHLQKFRLYLKRLSGVAQHQSALSNSFCGSMELNAKVGSLSRLNFQTLAASGQIAPQTLAALHAELMGRPSGGLVLPAIDPPVLMQASVQRPNCIPVETAAAVGQPLLKCQSNMSKQLPQSSIPVEDISEFSAWSSDHLGTAGSSRGVNNTQNCNTLVQMLQQQPYPAEAESNHAINVQPSRLVVPSQSSNSFQITNSPVFLNQNSVAIPSQSSTSFQFGINPVTIKQSSISNNTSSVGDYILFSSQSNAVSLNARQVTDESFKNGGMLDGYSTHGPLPSPVSSCSVRIASNTGWKAHNLNVNAGPTHRLPDHLPNLSFLATEQRAPMLSDAGHGRYLGFVGKGTCIPSRFAVDDIESPTNDVCNKKTCTDDGGRVKQEIQLDIMEGYNFGDTVQPYFSANNMGVLSE